MLHNLLTFSLSFLLLTFIGCRNQPLKTPPVNKNDCSQVMDTINRVLVTYTEALRNTRSYDSICRTHWRGSVPIKAYTIRAIDLLAALGMPASYADSSICRFKHVRVYMGYKDKVGFKLYIMPVTGACLQGNDPSKWQGGKDVLLDKHGNPAMESFSPSGIDTDDTYLLDLNAPCPNTCPQQLEKKP